MTFVQQINHWSGPLCLVLSAAVLLLGILAARTQKKLTRVQRTWEILLGGVDSGNVERLLVQHLEERNRQSLELEQIRNRLHSLESRMMTAKRFSGLVKYDAFEGVGGEQSFSMALFDDHGNGVVVTSQVGRAESRVFGKRLVEGRCDKGLTDEEEAAIREAAGGKSRPQISP